MDIRTCLSVLLLGLAGCNGRVTVAVTDAPVDSATSVTVQFTAVELERSDGSVERFDFSPPKSIDLLALEGGQRAVLLDENVPKDDYRAIRLRLSADGSGNDSFIDLSDGRHPLELAAEDEGRLKLSRRFSVSPNDDLFFTVDFDLRKSVVPPSTASDPHRLVPALRLLEDKEIGVLAGAVAAAWITTGCAPAVYVYTGSGATPDDVGSATEPLNTGRVLRNNAGEYNYRVGMLPAGTYTAALTCQAGDDQPDANDSIAFTAQSNVTIDAEQTRTENF